VGCEEACLAIDFAPALGPGTVTVSLTNELVDSFPEFYNERIRQVKAARHGFMKSG
jgi:hypothetical protein